MVRRHIASKQIPRSVGREISEQGDSPRGTSSIATQLQIMSTPAEKLEISRTAITTRLAEFLSVATDDIDSNMPTSRYGVDSMVAGELRDWLIKTLGFEVSMLQLLSKSGKIQDFVKGAAKIDGQCPCQLGEVRKGMV